MSDSTTTCTSSTRQRERLRLNGFFFSLAEALEMNGRHATVVRPGNARFGDAATNRCERRGIVADDATAALTDTQFMEEVRHVGGRRSHLAARLSSTRALVCSP